MSVSYESRMLSARILCNKSIPPTEESDGVQCVCVLSRNLNNEEALARVGFFRCKKGMWTNNQFVKTLVFLDCMIGRKFLISLEYTIGEWRKSITRSFIIFKQGNTIEEDKMKMVHAVKVHTDQRYLTWIFQLEYLMRRDKLGISRHRRQHDIRRSGLNSCASGNGAVVGCCEHGSELI